MTMPNPLPPIAVAGADRRLRQAPARPLLVDFPDPTDFGPLRAPGPPLPPPSPPLGRLAVVHGVAEPTEGLIAQPGRAQLRYLKVSNGEISRYMFLIGLPWLFKLLFGLTSDFVPLFGSRRKSYLLLSSSSAASPQPPAGCSSRR